MIDLVADLPAATPEAIKAARQAAGQTQAQAGAALGASRGAWAQWEGDIRTMSATPWALYLLATGQHPTAEARPKDGA